MILWEKKHVKTDEDMVVEHKYGLHVIDVESNGCFIFGSQVGAKKLLHD